MRIAIIGIGYSGLATAWFLLNHDPIIPNLQVFLYDRKELGQGASGIAAGLLHPFSGAHAKYNWQGMEGFAETLGLLNIASAALGKSVFSAYKGILRLALNDQQEEDFARAARLYPKQIDWLDPKECQLRAPGCANKPGIWIKDGLTIYTGAYLQGLMKACKEKGAIFEFKTIHTLDDLAQFDLIIATTGGESSTLSELNSLNLSYVRGQVLEVSWPKDLKPLTCALNSHIYLVMKETMNSCLIGATYERGSVEMGPNVEIAKKQLLPRLMEMYPALSDTPIINCFAGLRAVSAQHRPLIKQLSPKRWVLTGMGSKGLLYHALFAKELIAKIDYKTLF